MFISYFYCMQIYTYIYSVYVSKRPLNILCCVFWVGGKRFLHFCEHAKGIE